MSIFNVSVKIYSCNTEFDYAALDVVAQVSMTAIEREVFQHRQELSSFLAGSALEKSSNQITPIKFLLS